MALHHIICDSHELQMDELQSISGICPPNLSSGALVTLKNINSWMWPIESHYNNAALVLPNPSMNLSLPYPKDELLLAQGRSTIMPNDIYEVRRHLSEDYSLDPNIIDQPVASLSGGERMLISLCKAEYLANKSGAMVVCSPYYWLDSIHRSTIRTMLIRQGNSGKDVRLLTLRGEESNIEDTKPTLCDSIQSFNTVPDVSWTLICPSTQVLFRASTFPIETTEKLIVYEGSPRQLNLQSPTLVSGLNGVGKTTFAKLLCNLLPGVRSRISIISNGVRGLPRLLMQDSVVQLFGQSPSSQMRRVFTCDKENHKSAISLLNNITSACIRKMSSIDSSIPVIAKDGNTTLLQTKLALIVERLVSKPPLLILDEPGWCLSRQMALEFVNCVVLLAHEQGTAVAIISHQIDWWGTIVNSTITMTQNGKGSHVIISKEIAK